MTSRWSKFLGVSLFLATASGVCYGATPSQATAEATRLAWRLGTAAPNHVWLWSPDESDDEGVAVNFTLNCINRSAVDVKASRLPGCGWVFDYTRLARDADDARELRHLFNLLAFDDSRFHEPARRGSMAGIGDAIWYAPPARGLGASGVEFQRATQRVTIPMLDARRFVAAALSTVEVQGIEPRYYAFRELRAGATRLEEYLANRGASLDRARELLAVEHALIRRSNVTGKERSIVAWRGQGVRPSGGTGLVSLTLDLFDESVEDERKSFTRNLLLETADGYELIAETPSGWHEFTLWNGAGTLVAEAPPNLASDHTIPTPHTRRLQAAISCIRCHGADEGWREFEAWLPESDGFGVVGDASDDFDPDNLSTLRARYGGDLAVAFRLGRDSYAARIFAATGVNEPAAAHDATAAVYRSYVYDVITEEDVFQELGVDSWDDMSNVADPVVEALRQGLGVGRGEFEEVWPILAGAVKQ